MSELRRFRLCRNISGLFFAVVISLSASFGFAISVNAETKTTPIFQLKSTSNMAVTIYFDTEMPDISFIAPNGTVYLGSELKFEQTDKGVCYFLPNALPGQWQLEYDKKGNAELDINWAPYTNAINVDYLRFEPISDSLNTNVSFYVSADLDGWYNYTLNAAVLDSEGNVSGYKELKKSSGPLNREQIISVNVGNLQSHDKYYFYLDVWRDEYGLESATTAISEESFAINNLKANEQIADVITNVDLTEKIISFDWTEFAVHCDEYIFGLFDKALDIEPIYANSFAKNTTTTEVIFDEQTEKLRVELSYLRSGFPSNILKKEIPMKTGTEFVFPESDITSSKQILVSYKADRNVDAVVNVNGKEQPVSLKSGDNSFSVNIDDFDNVIIIKYSLDDESTVYSVTHKVSVDSTAPILLLPENDVTLYVETETFELAGSTEVGASVDINGEAVIVGADGTFVHTLSLAEGDNEFIVNSTDIAGNVASQFIVIHRLKPGVVVGNTETKSLTDYLPLIITIVSSFGVFIEVVILTKLFNSNRKVSKAFAVVSLLRNITLIGFFVSGGLTAYYSTKFFEISKTVKSEKLFEEASESISDAYNLVMQYDAIRDALFRGIIACVILFVLFIALLVISILIKNNMKKKLAKPVPPPISKPVEYVCSNCGVKYDVPINFCEECGTKMF